MRIDNEQAAGRPAALEAAARTGRDLGKDSSRLDGTSAANLCSSARTQAARRRARQPFVPRLLRKDVVNGSNCALRKRAGRVGHEQPG